MEWAWAHLIREMRSCPFSGGTLRSGDVCGRISMPVDGGCGLGGRESVARVGLQRTGLGGVSRPKQCDGCTGECGNSGDGTKKKTWNCNI